MVQPWRFRSIAPVLNQTLMPSSAQDASFAEDMDSMVVVDRKHALDRAIDWISSNLEPIDVFSEKDLEAWAEANGYKRD